MIRPKSIKYFELCYLGAVLAGGVNTAMTWASVMASDQGQEARAMVGPWFLPIAFVFAYTLALLLWYFTARVPSRVAKWVLVLCFGLSLFSFGFGVMNMTFDTSNVLAVVTLLLNGAAVWFLFRRDSTAWFAKA